MWAKLDDALLDHPKIITAGVAISRGKEGRLMALGLYTAGILYANKHLTDGFLPRVTVEHLAGTKSVQALVAAKLWKTCDGGFMIHDYHDHNPTADEYRSGKVLTHEQKVKAGRAGGLKSGEVRREARMKQGP